MERIEDCISFLLGKAYQQVTQDAKRRLARFGVTPVQYGLLKVLWEEDEQSGAALGERLVLDSATITGVVDRLERAGLVERRSDPGDRRVNRVALTPKGRALRAPLDREMEKMNVAFLGALDAAERKRLRATLETIARPGRAIGGSRSEQR
jgi:DNA-binding MarR family transcriptional regulator